MPTLFSKIANREIPGIFVAENNEFFAILDIAPLVKGHVLVIPKLETDYLFDLEPDYLGRYFQFAQQVAKAIDLSIDCKRVGVAVIGLEVPHAHIHLVPLNSVQDINFTQPKISVSTIEMIEIAEKIASSFSAAD